MYYIKIILFVAFFCILPGSSWSAITLPWLTTFNYEECTQFGLGGAINCDTVKNDGIQWNWGNTTVDGHYTQNATAANNPDGDGGNGFRAWIGDGRAIQTGTVRIDLPSAQKELWMRWYVRYEAGFVWSTLESGKMMWIFTNSSTSAMSVIPEWNNNHAGDAFTVIALQAAEPYKVITGTDGGWNSTMGGSVSDGKFHCIEFYIKMDTDQTDGIGRIWIDGVLKASAIDVDWSNGDSVSKLGWTWLQFYGNQYNPNNGRAVYVDYDDMAIYGSTPPNRDAQGNAFIGPIRLVSQHSIVKGAAGKLFKFPTGKLIKVAKQ